MDSKSRRAKPLPLHDRQKAILDAVIPLLLEKGPAVTTAEMAAAARIAEGTIFRAFQDKATVLHEALKSVMNPLPVREALWRIPTDAPMEDQLRQAAEALAGYIERGAALIGMLRAMPHPHGHHPTEARRHARESMALITEDLAAIFGRHRDQLWLTPARAAVALRGLIFTNTHPLLAPDDRLTADEIVAIVLSGVTVRAEAIR
jgi:AcrR family transcriptional regulator